MNRTNDRKAARWELITLGGLVILAAALRMARIEAREPWLDEACTALFASESLDRLWEILAVESHPPLYYLFMSAWTRLFGIGPLAIRSPSFLAGLVLVWLVWRGVRAFGGGRPAALLAAGACAVSPVMIYYSIEAKAYTLLWSVYLGGVLLLRAGAAGKGRRRAFIGAGLLTVIAVYTHYYGLILLLLWLPALVFAPNPARRWGFASVSVALLLYLPWVISSMGIQVNSGGTAWLAMFVEDPWTMMGRSVLIMSQVPPFPSYLGELGLVDQPAGLAVLGGIWLGSPVLAGMLLLRRPMKSLKELMLRTLLPAAMLLPLVVPAVASVWRPVYLPGRYELLAYGPFLILWGLGVEVLLDASSGKKRYAWLLAGILTAGAMVPSSIAFLTTDRTNPMERIGKHLEEDAPGEPVVTVGVAWAPLEYQFRLRRDHRSHLSHPRDIAFEHPGWLVAAQYDLTGLEVEARETLDDFGGAPGIWVIVGLEPGGAMAQPQLVGTLWGTLVAAGWVPGPPEVHGSIGLVRFRPPDVCGTPR